MNDQARPPADLTGRTVGGGRYVLRALLGRGGMASVHLAWDTVLERQVAIKTMHSELGSERDFRERFKREAQSVAKLTHTNIVSVFDTGEDLQGESPVPYIVMEFVEGRPLRDLLDEDVEKYGAMPAATALRITADVLAALDISHEMGLVHRDIKPGNVMIAKRGGTVKVMDFGIARAMQSSGTAMTQTGMVVGTPQYLSPEQALGRGVDARSDLYSVGVMLFELLTGRLPFDADNPLAIAYAHVQEEPPAPSTVNTALPPAVDALVGRALRKNPNERFPSAEELRAECLRVAGTLSGEAPRIDPAAAAPGNSGAGIAASVYPQFGAPTPPSVAQANPATPLASPYAPGGYGYPQPGHGPGTPAPYAITPTVPVSPGGGAAGAGGGRRGAVGVVIAAVVAIAVVAAVAVYSLLDGDGEKGSEAGGGSDTGAEDVTDNETEREPRFKEGDPEKVIDATSCVHANDYWDQDESPGAKSTPNFYGFHINSVKECIRSAGWRYEENLVYKDEVLLGENMVVNQTPARGEPFDPEEMVIELTVSTGREPDRG
ncbi:protein kinase domain-containing protein [Streptomyces sp. NRRL F-2890]|uniref:protein kinase domain-containing protein n=1 Tax=Streptomyces sp. NRRL F-2890 TaxID=1463845 RepID=UPI0004CA7488|nr:protein kinase [Streptomyces sp. NRRL F-2890]